jgi:hypothetical protein
VALDAQPKTIMNAYLHFNQEQHVFICKVHQYAVSSKLLARHFSEEHNLAISVRDEIIKYASEFTTAESSQLIYSTDKVLPVPYLSIIDGFQCEYESCDKVLGTLASVKHHCKVDHDWKVKDGQKWIETRAQTFFKGNIKRYVH